LKPVNDPFPYSLKPYKARICVLTLNLLTAILWPY
jgi:hypothetical protein